MRLLSGLIAVVLVLVLPASASAISIIGAPPEMTNMTSAAFNFEPSEGEVMTYGINGAQCQLDGGPWATCVTGQSYSNLGPGVHNFGVRGTTNGTAVAETESHHMWTIDLTPPVASIASGPSGETTAKSATFNVSSNETGSSFQCAVDSTTLVPCQVPVTFTGLAVGNHTFRATTTDPAGNISAQVTRTWTIRADTVPPDTTITAAPPEVNNLADPSVEFTASEASTFQCSVNGGPFGTCASPYILSALADGAITFQVRAVDLAENIDPTPATAAWTRDTTPPAAPAVFVGRRTRAAQKATGVTAVFQTSTQLRAVWDRAEDAATSEVQFRSTPGGRDPELGTWTPLPTDPTATQADVVVPTGKTGCVRVRSIDGAGNASAWSLKCTTLPYKASSATVNPLFRKRSGSRHFAGGYVRYAGRGTSRAYLRLRLTPAATAADVKRVSLVATTCRACGTVRIVVTSDGTPPVSQGDIAGSRTLSLRSRRIQRKRVLSAIVFPDALPSLERRYVYVFAVGRRGERRIEGIGVSSS